VIRIFWHQTRYDLLMFARNRQARFFTAALPVLFLVIFASVFGNQRIGAMHVKASTYYVPGIAALAVLTTSFSNLVISITSQRERGILKRRRATPAPAVVMIAGRTATSLMVSLAVTAILIAIGVTAYGVRVAAGSLGALVVSVAIGSLAFGCLGYAMTTVVASADSAQPATLVVTLPLGFISGVYVPSPNLPAALHHVAQAFPLEHLVAAFSQGFLPGGAGIAWGDLGVIAIWGLAGLAVGLRRFQWTPALR
jgi:ABC-2 type transport system permease protein